MDRFQHRMPKKIIIINLLFFITVLFGIFFNLWYLCSITGEKIVEPTEEKIELVIDKTIEGSIYNPFQIRSVQEFVQFAASVNRGNTYAGQYVELKCDLDFENVAEGYSVGIADSEARFMGNFNGFGHSISNIKISKPDGEAGLFVNLSGTVSNLQVENSEIDGAVSGGIASTVAYGGIITNCINRATVNGSLAGGIVGKSSGKIVDCVNYVSDKGTTLFAGDNTSGVIEYSYHQTESGLMPYFDRYGDTTPPEETRPMLQVLNDRLSRLNALYQGNHWSVWEMEGQNLILTEQSADLLKEATIQVKTSGNDRLIKGYYSENEDAWCFAIPNGTEYQDREVLLFFQTGTSQQMTVTQNASEAEWEQTGIHYKFKFLINQVIPSIFIDTSGENEEALALINADKNNAFSGEMVLLDEMGSMQYTGIVSEISGRGNDSFLAEKKGYNIKLQSTADLLKMGGNKDFILLPGYRDNSLLTYKITQDMAKEIGIAYAPESRFINLYIDGEFLGMYLLTEKMEIDKNRIDLNQLYKETKKMNGDDLSIFQQQVWESTDSEAKRIWYDIKNEPDDNSGGYLLELDTKDFSDEQSRFVSERGISITLKSNVYASKTQVNYIADFWQDFEDAVFSEDGYNDKGKYYSEYIDMESFATQWLLYELHEDSSMTGSIYFYKDSDNEGDGLLHAAYLWDVEHSFVEENNLLKSWIMGAKRGDLNENAPYWVALYQHDDFAQLVSEKWVSNVYPAVQKLLVAEEVFEINGLSSIGGYERAYTDIAAINSTRWTDCNIWDKGERIRIFLNTRSMFLSKVLPAFSLPYDYYELVDGIYYGCYYDEDSEHEDVKEALVAQ